MRRLTSIVLAAAIATGPASQAASAAGRAVSLGSSAKTAPITAVPGRIGSPAAGLSINSVGSLEIGSRLPSLAPTALPQANGADAARAENAAISNTISNRYAGNDAAAPSPAAPLNRVSGQAGLELTGAREIGGERAAFISGKDGAGTPTIGEVVDAASRLAEAAPESVSLIKTSARRPGDVGAMFDGSRAANANLADGTRVRDEAPAVRAKKPGRLRRWIGGAARLLTAPIRLAAKKKPAVDTAYTKDDFGGYKPISGKALPENATRFQKIRAKIRTHAGYGLKWGVNLFAIATILNTVAAPVFAAVPWQLFLSETALNAFGRVELLTAFGPAQIVGAMTMSPVAFMLLALPAAVFMEELRHRVVSFGGWFIGTALIRPVAKKITTVLDDIPDISGLRSTLQWILGKLAGVSKSSYGIAALISASGFAMAHVAMWGFHPYLIFYHAVMGYALAHIAYRSRFVAAPFIAHYLFNAATIALGVVVPTVFGAQTAAIASTLAGLGSVAFLYYNWRSWRKAKRAAAMEARGETPAPAMKKSARWYGKILGAFMLPVMIGAGLTGTPAPDNGPMHAVHAKQTLVQDQADADKKADPADGALPKVHTPAQLQQLLNRFNGGGAAPAAAAAKDLSTVEIVQRNKMAVVNVMTRGGTGTGFIISPDGTLVTNAHVVAESVNQATGKISREHKTQIVIRLANGQKVPAQVVGYNPDKDIAIVKILPVNPFGWPTVKIGDSSKLLEGQDIVAMGYPLGQPFTVTKGIISGLGFRGNGFIQFQQHDAAVNPGNSGGPLFNMQGEVVGINTQIVSPSGAFAGISRSITSSDLQAALAQYAKQGNISSSWLGAVFYPQDPSADGFGAGVEAVRPDSPAAQAGLLAGDVIVGVDGRGLPADATQAFGMLSALMRQKAPTDSITLQIDRDGTVMDIAVTLGAH
jgi:S1-C subfamily serine protease